MWSGIENPARLRTRDRRFFTFDGRRRCRRLVGRRTELGALQPLVLVLEGDVHLDQRLLLGLGDRRVAQDLADQVVLALTLLEDAGTDVAGLGGASTRLGGLLQEP